MSRSSSLADRPRGGRVAILAVFLTALALPAPAVERYGDVAPALVGLALSESERLSRPGRGRPEGDRLLIRNLTRYFVTYPVSEDPTAVAGLLETVSEAGADWAEEVLTQASELAPDEATNLEKGAVAAAIAQRLPSRLGDFDDVVFFPQNPRTAIAIETADLAAFLDTGFTWDVLLSLAERELGMEWQALSIGEAEVEILASATNAYTLLVLRQAGRLARDEPAPHVAPAHVDEAISTLERRGASDSSEEAPPAPAKAGSIFTEVGAETGLEFRHRSSSWLHRFRRYGSLAPTFSGGGVTSADLDGDGRQDLVLCGGHGCATFRNEGKGRFRDTSERTGLTVDGEARMALVADLDDDGWRDVFITYARHTNRLFRGLPDGRFADVTSGSGVERDGDISGPAVVFDADGDGRLDLYVGNFGNYLRGRHPWGTDNANNATPNRFYRGLSELRFAEVARSGAENTGWTQAISHLDLDRDGDQDLYLANDFGRNELLANNGQGFFQPIGAESRSDDPFHGMNVSFTDANRDGVADIFVTNIWAYRPREDRLAESNSLLLSTPGEGATTRYQRAESPWVAGDDSGWAWAAQFFDYDNDGRDDLFVANGFTDYLTFVQYRRHPRQPETFVPINNGGEANLLYRGAGDGSFVLVPGSGAEIDDVNSRAAVPIDYDQDGDTDLAVTTFHSHARLLRNDIQDPGHWLSVSLRGDPNRGVNGPALGSVIRVRADSGIEIWRPVTGGGAYLSMDAEEIEIGLGDASAAQVEITWPGGARYRFLDVPAGRRVRFFY